jgi:hypothetical protein
MDNGKAQLGALGLQEGELLKLLMLLSLGLLPLPIGINRCIRQVMASLLGHLVSPAHLRNSPSRRVIFWTRPYVSS